MFVVVVVVAVVVVVVAAVAVVAAVVVVVVVVGVICNEENDFDRVNVDARSSPFLLMFVREIQHMCIKKNGWPKDCLVMIAGLNT